VSQKDIGGGANDYALFASWEAWVQTQSFASEEHVGYLYAVADTPSPSNALLVIDGSSPNATHPLRVEVPASTRHQGVYDAAKCVAVQTYDYRSCLQISDPHVRVRGLQIVAPVSGSPGYAVVLANGATAGIVLEDLIVVGGANNLSVGGGTVTLRNSVCYEATGEGVYAAWDWGAPTVTLENVTVAKPGTTGIRRDGGTFTATNCYAQQGSGAAYNGSITKTTCASSDSSGSAGLQNIAASTATFVSVSAGSEDYHLAAGSALIGAATDLSGSFTTDIDGDARSSWDIGADEYLAAGGGTFQAAWAAQANQVIGSGYVS
jgi:hypothetical protein